MAMSSKPFRQEADKWQWPRVRAKPALILLALFVGSGLLQGIITALAMADRTDPSTPIAAGLSAALAAWFGLPAVQLGVFNAPSPRRGWPRFLGVHLLSCVLFTAIHFGVDYGLRWFLCKVLPIRSPDWLLHYTETWEMQYDWIIYGALAGIWALVRTWEERRQAALRTAQLETQLVRARLDALAAQLDPHFLFNALNTVSALMYEDLERTERLLSSLGSLLRATLGPGGPSWSLGRERAHSEQYLELLGARFGDRLSVSWDIAPGLEETEVPRFCIQTLVENAVKHNQDRIGPLAICIRGVKEEERLSISVEDNGVGFAKETSLAAPPRGLARLEEILRLLHGDRARLDRGKAPAGGARVALYLPCGGQP
jgi:two-component system, LytTR family, sensor kinase